MNVIAALVVVIGLAILSSAPVAYFMGDSSDVVWELALCAVMTVAMGTAAFMASKVEKYTLGPREGFGIVTFGWLAAAAVGAIPFVVVADMQYHDAFFETMSGFTTTGASVLDKGLPLLNGKFLSKGIADLPKGLLFWRSLTHWLGGMGIVVLSLAIIPFLGIGGQQLYDAEVPGPTSDQLTPRIANSAKILWGVYILLSIAETLLLLPSMNLFDAWCHTCGTMATGGFSTIQSSVGGYDNLYIDIVITIFMFLAGGNFILHFKALRGKPIAHFKDEEFVWYLGITLAATAGVTLALMLSGQPIHATSGAEIAPTFPKSLRYASFQVVSILTTTGFCTADFAVWPAFACLSLLILMFIGGCGGSTGGGMKVSRFILALKYGVARVRRTLFPNELSNVRLNAQRVDPDTLHKVMGFFFLFVSIFVLFVLVMSLFPGVDFTTAVSSSIACLGNIGPGLAKVGATCTYAWLHPAAKILLSIAMLLGRLEIYTVIVVLLPTFWKK